MALWSCAIPTAPARASSVSLVSGDSGPVVQWFTSALEFYLHPACSDDLPVDACLDEVRASFGQWLGSGCSDVSFTDLGYSNNLGLLPVGGPSNGRNELGWVERGSLRQLLPQLVVRELFRLLCRRSSPRRRMGRFLLSR